MAWSVGASRPGPRTTSAACSTDSAAPASAGCAPKGSAVSWRRPLLTGWVPRLSRERLPRPKEMPSMRPLAFLQVVARAALKGGANLLGFGVGDLVGQVWKDWKKDKDEAARKTELQ